MSNMDMATALDISMNDENEAKFIALKNLQTKKLKQLMTSIDNKDKEIAKLKILGKDNRRTQMIQALRNKIRDMELINDVLKEELKNKMEDASIEDVNNMIIRKTLGGPKRFRPLTREELENKIIELEKKNLSVSNRQKEQDSKQNNQHINSSNNRNSNDNKISRENVVSIDETFLQSVGLIEEITILKTQITSKDKIINHLKEEISNLKSKNAELSVAEEELEFVTRQYNDSKAYNEALIDNLNNTTKELSDMMEQVLKYKSQFTIEMDSKQIELNELNKLNQKILLQNANLLNKITQYELEIENQEANKIQNDKLNMTSSITHDKKDMIIKNLEDKISKLEEKLKISEINSNNQQEELLQLNSLKNQLRDKNIAMKEMKRNLEEKDRIISSLKVKNGIVGSPVHSNGDYK
eukprot:gene17529-24299_t